MKNNNLLNGYVIALLRYFCVSLIESQKSESRHLNNKRPMQIHLPCSRSVPRCVCVRIYPPRNPKIYRVHFQTTVFSCALRRDQFIIPPIKFIDILFDSKLFKIHGFSINPLYDVHWKTVRYRIFFYKFNLIHHLQFIEIFERQAMKIHGKSFGVIGTSVHRSSDYME